MTGRVLVTGATGFIGSHLVEELLWKGYEVTALVRQTSDLRWLRGKGVKLLYGDLEGDAGLPPLKGFDYIFHLAGVTKAVRHADYYRINKGGTERILAAARKADKLKRFVFLSSLSAAGPSPADRALTEEDPPHPVSPYGESKLLGELAVLAVKDKLPVTILRPCIIYGPRDTYSFELFKTLAKGFMPQLGKEPKTLSFCYVEDLVQALMLSIQRDHPSGEIFFVSDGEKYPLDFFADVVSSLLKIRLRRIPIPLWGGWVCAVVADGWGYLRGRPASFSRSKFAEAKENHWVCDISKARKMLGFRPRFRLEAGVRVTLQWYKVNDWL